jgi:hypothetical protein
MNLLSDLPLVSLRQRAKETRPARYLPRKFGGRQRLFAAWTIATTVLLQTGCAGYHLGNQYLYRSDIRTVHVAMFESDSYRRFLGLRLTEAVVKEIELSSPLTITEPQLANSFIRGRILSDQKRLLGETLQDDARTLETGWRVEVTWIDRAGVPLMQKQVIRIDREATFVPEAGQSLSTAQQEIIERIARDIVGQMEMPSL